MTDESCAGRALRKPVRGRPCVFPVSRTTLHVRGEGDNARDEGALPTTKAHQLFRIVRSIAAGFRRQFNSSRKCLACSMPFRWCRGSRYRAGVASLPLLAFSSAPLTVTMPALGLSSVGISLRPDCAFVR